MTQYKKQERSGLWAVTPLQTNFSLQNGYICCSSSTHECNDLIGATSARRLGSDTLFLVLKHGHAVKGCSGQKQRG
jgi:hypothetical protein